ncbi:MAG: helix-turn-helix domain-containing protein [Devosia sp.]
MTVRFEKTASGEVAVLPRAEYEALLERASEADEDSGTARILARGRRDLEAGAPLLPLAVVDRIADGENAVRVIRQWRNETQLHLEVLTGISQSHISDIENGRRTGTSATLRKLADALRVPLDVIA